MSQQELETLLNGLIDGWCERRTLGPLRIILQAWPMPMGLTDDWHALRDALRHVRAMEKESLTESELERLSRAITLVDIAIFGPPTR